MVEQNMGNGLDVAACSASLGVCFMSYMDMHAAGIGAVCAAITVLSSVSYRIYLVIEHIREKKRKSLKLEDDA